MEARPPPSTLPATFSSPPSYRRQSRESKQRALEHRGSRKKRCCTQQLPRAERERERDGTLPRWHFSFPGRARKCARKVQKRAETLLKPSQADRKVETDSGRSYCDRGDDQSSCINRDFIVLNSLFSTLPLSSPLISIFLLYVKKKNEISTNGSD